ncbi:hypothetical protein [Shewanella sp.]|uniref:hypothetical protein n=1 Tax=Shewanella sp. TaxID=50422 RepID=UPI003563496B
MVESMKSVMKFLKTLHWIGVVMLVAGIGLYLGTEVGGQLTGMLVIAVLIGLGLVFMSPYPVVLAIEWGKAQASERESD